MRLQENQEIYVFTMPRRTPTQFILEAMTACLPASAPVPFKVLDSIFECGKTAIGKVELFDGKQGTLKASKWSEIEGAWSIKWLQLDGGPIVWNGVEWERVNENNTKREAHDSRVEPDQQVIGS